MKIAMIGSRGFPGFAGGVEKALEEICPRLAAMGHGITVYASTRVTVPENEWRGVALRKIPALDTKHFETISRTCLASADAAFRGFDVIHYHAIGPALFAWLPRVAGKKIAVTVHGLDWQRDKWGPAARAALRAGERSALLFAHRIVVVSRHLERYFRSRHGRETTYIPNGVSAEEPLPPRSIARNWSLGRRDYILFASRLVPEKGCHTLIEAYSRLHIPQKLVIAGAGWHSDGYVAKLKEMARQNPNIIFTGWAEGDVLRELFSNAYLYCLPSVIEGMSLSLLEAMAHALCPLVSDIPENTDVTGPAGIPFAAGDAGGLARRLAELAEDAPRVEAAGRAAKERVAAEYDWDEAARRLERLYTGMAGASRC